MNTQAEQILQSALTLHASERAEIAATLIRSLDEKSEDVLDAEWAEEIRRRIESIEKGEVQLIPADEVMREMRARLNG